MAASSWLRWVLSFFVDMPANEASKDSRTSNGPQSLSGEVKKSPVVTVDEVRPEAERPDYATMWPNDLGFDTVREERQPIELKVTGYIPAYAAGTLYRNGPGAHQLKDSDGNVRYQCSHWFDGFSQAHRFELVRKPYGENASATMLTGSQTPSSTSDRIERIRYQSRFNVDALMQSCIDKGRYDGYTFAQKRDPCMSMFRKVMCLFTPVPNALAGQGDGHSVSVTISANTTGFPLETSSSGHKPGNVLVARTDECHMKALDAETLEPIGMAHQRSLHPLLKGQLSASHAKSDPQTGDVFNYNLDLIGRYPAYRVFKTSAATGETSILATISAPEVKAAYMHSFFLSANFVVLAIWSAHLKAGGISVLWEKNIMDAIAPFADDQTVKWFVIDRRHGQGVVACFESAAAFSFHSINAFEEPAGTAGGLQEEEDSGTRIDILCDCIEYENFNVVHKFYYENMRSSAPSTSTVKGSFDKQSRFGQHFARYRLGYIPSSSTLSKLPPLSTGELESARQLPAYRQAQKVLQLRAAGAIGDIPTLNPSRLTKEHRYFWNCTFDSAKSSFMEGLCKVDIVESQRLGKPVGVKWKNPPGHTPGEGIFVADPDGTEEDDGVLLTIVLDGFNETSYLLCLDARTMEKLGRADCAGPLAFQFHGQHVNSKGDRPIDV